jgi:hypothetical protein
MGGKPHDKGVEMKEYKFNAGDGMFWHDNYGNNDKQGNPIERCTICARKLGENPVFVEVHNGGDLVEFGKGIHDGGYMGCWPIGSECAKQFSPELIGHLK